ncbi:PREDICTED: probable aspartyl protease At4g16563 [Nicotiana attenuata]|uniref:Aspartyl protease n=1 Tax=Nicotiana attenuata TaxID=49451 RepID=A0A1J6IWM5_NICAT|nr:PREDICTED: probable aspartyl protease At4g16563 [Nicotiana attenuata]OIS99544.1 putative aspartyl protease [Nicotiana attenuata]
MASSVFFTLFTFFLLFLFSYAETLVFPLTHSLSKTQYNSTHHLLKSTSARSATRLHHHRHPHRQVSLPLTPGSDYTLSFSLGSQTISLYMDTGSDVVWLPCHPFDCILCEGKYNPSTIPNPGPLNLTSAVPVTCKSRSCSAVHSSMSSSNLCAMAKCPLEDIEISDCKSYTCPPFYYAYGDGSFIAKLYNDKLSMPTSSPSSLILHNFTFGCAHSALGEPIGVAGFGRGKLSLPAQLAINSPEIGNFFSYCLVSHSFDTTKVHKPSPLILGRYSVDEKMKQMKDYEIGYAYTAMLENPKHPYFYCVGLEAVTIGKMKIPTPASLRRVDGRGNGGMVVDSGTTFTMLPHVFYETVVTEFDKRVGPVYKRANPVEERTGLSPCYYLDKGTSNVPQLLLHFGGNSSVVMPKRNYFYEFLDGGDDGNVKRKVGCVMLMNGGVEEESGPAGLMGNYQQQGFEVVYDLEKKRVGFARRKCASLWDNLNQH